MNDYTAKKHYENLLARHYSWMFGDFDEQVTKNREWFTKHGIHPHSNQKAIDLGCGSGFQTFALSSLGFNVTAVDFNRELLDELKNRDHEDTIEAIQSDILEPIHFSGKAPFELVVCMGDTLPHLPEVESVSKLFGIVCKLLEKNGKLVLNFRNLSVKLMGTERFIPVRQEPDKIMTVFLEYVEEFVLVHDLIHTRQGDSWALEKSAYKKLRLSPKQVEYLLLKTGFKIDFLESRQGMVYVVAVKPN